MNNGIRINKAIAMLGICSRRAADKLILEKSVYVNKKLVTELGVNVSANDVITVSRKDYAFKLHKVTKIWLYYKPVGLVTTHKDEKGRATVFDDLRGKINERVISVGRLDLNSEGLLLLTNDSKFANMAETSNWERRYKVRVFGRLTNEVISQIEKGVTIDGVHYAPVKITTPKVQADKKNAWIECVLTEGKNREIRKIFAHFGIAVNRLIRYKYGKFELNDLKPGEVCKN